MDTKQNKLESEKVIVEAPFSFTGATKRIWPFTEKSDNPYIKYLILMPTVLAVLCFCYAMIFVWYCLFGIFLLPYRLIRRSQRQKRRSAHQHREVLQAIASQRKI